MKHQNILIFILLLSLVFASCTRPQPKPPIEVSITWSEVDQGVGLEVGNSLEIVLPADSSAGYIWEVGFYNQSVLKPYGEPEFTNNYTNLDVQELQKLHFEAIGVGETELKLVNERAFENEGLDHLQIFHVNVAVK